MYFALTLDVCCGGGLSVCNKIPDFDAAFDGWDVEVVSKYKQSKIDELMANPKIIRNKLKIVSIIVCSPLASCVCVRCTALSCFRWFVLCAE
jgi:3-methyladenine DNA glycosylase Tag